MPLPLTVSCFSKIQIGFTFLVPAHPGSPGQRAVKCVCVCVCVQTSLASVESKQSQAENDVRQMRTSLRDYELLVDDYRTQVTAIGSFHSQCCQVLSHKIAKDVSKQAQNKPDQS